MRVEIDSFEVDLDAYELRHEGEIRPVEPLVFDLLAYLIRHRDRVVTKAELLDNVWGDRFVSESALTRCVKALRHALDDDGRTQRVIRTVHGRGYRLVAPVVADVAPAPLERLPITVPPRQQIRFCHTSDGARLAYVSTGRGFPLVKVANWLSHLEYDWESPVWRHWWTDLSRRHALTRYDERGCGLSDWGTNRFDLDAWVEDLEVVVDAVGLERFDLIGISQGGVVATTYATIHPERVRRLVLYGTYTRGRMARAETDEERAEAELQIQLARVGWGRDDPSFRRVFAMQFIPDGSYELWEQFAELQRRTTSPENAVRFMASYAQLDVRQVAPLVTVPTMLLHGRGDRRVPIEEGRRLAASIPGSRFVTLESSNHILLADEAAWPRFLEEVETFLDDT